MTKSTTSAKVIRNLIVAVIWLTIWQAISMIIDEEILFVSPLKVFQELCRMSLDGSFWLTLLASVGRVVGGFTAGFAVAVVLAAVSFRFEFIKSFLSPAISVVKSTPVASFIILALMWIGKSFVPSVISMLMVIPIVWSNTLSGLENVDSDLIEMSTAFKMPFGKRIKNVYFPSLMPYLLSASGSGLGLCWKAGIAAEVICRTGMSIGNNIWETKFYLETAQMFAWTAAVILLSVLFDRIVKSVYGMLIKKYKTED